MEVEQNQSLPLLDVPVSRRPDDSLGHKVYRKLTHTDLDIHAKFKHHPAQKRVVLKTLVQHAWTICNAESLNAEIKHCRTPSEKTDTATMTSSRPSTIKRKSHKHRKKSHPV